MWFKTKKQAQGWRAQATDQKPKKRKQWEKIAQKQSVAWFRFSYPQYRDLFYHIPNEGKRPEWVGRDLNQMGMQSGMLDLHLDIPHKAANGTFYYGLRIEMKPAKKDSPSSVTPEQHRTIGQLNAQGYFACVCYGFDEFKDAVQWYLA